ncbi:MAG: transcriptional repressor NrdR [Clostridiales bacterium]|nr:transcriptional repressor NrdR [Clostridiales bacterium]
MKCPFCGSLDSRVLDSRPTDEGSAIRRRRECGSCAKRFTTYEKIETLPLFVIKKDGRRESFNRNKIMSGLLKACEKRPIAIKELDKLVQDIEKSIYGSMEQEITSQKIGQMVMERLKDLDEVAYVRFASVYRQFKDVNNFIDELEKMIRDKGSQRD